MKVAIFGSRTINRINLKSFLPPETDEIVSGGAEGVDSVAAAYAMKNAIKLTEFLPDYKTYGKSAPIIRDKMIADYADMGIAFWDGKSKGTVHTVNFFKKQGKKVKLYIKSDI